MDIRISPSLEDYLEKILFLHQRNNTVRVTDVALEMDISKPSVNKAINILKKQGLVEHEHYGLLSLTQQGRSIAENVANRHFMLKRFLSEVIGVDEKTAEQDACQLEHAISPVTVEKMEAYLEKVFGMDEKSED